MTNSVGGLRVLKHVLSVHTNYNMTCESQTEKKVHIFPGFHFRGSKMWEYFGQVCKWNKCYDRETGNYWCLWVIVTIYQSRLSQSQNRKQSVQSHHSKNLEKSHAFNVKIAMQPESSTFNQGIKLLNRVDVVPLAILNFTIFSSFYARAKVSRCNHRII